MTVKELISQLESVENKNLPIAVHTRYDKDFSLASKIDVIKEEVYAPGGEGEPWNSCEKECVIIV